MQAEELQKEKDEMFKTYETSRENVCSKFLIMLKSFLVIPNTHMLAYCRCFTKLKVGRLTLTE
jgi:hypothetical protein